MFKRITFLKIIAWSYVKMLNSLPGSNNRASGFCFPFFQISHAPTDDFFLRQANGGLPHYGVVVHFQVIALPELSNAKAYSRAKTVFQP